ncbi:MAG: diacylglycerol kinase family protein [Clostridia bacterium]|nr:diacylglycerol kinase family protein [Clostridia bacterium]
MENKWKNKNFFQSLKNALNGVKFVWQYGSNIKIQVVFGILVTILGIILKISKIEFAILVLTIFIVLICEVFNTAIEKLVDLYTLEYNEIAKIIKDVAAGAVTLSAIMSIIIGIILFLPKIINYIAI